MESTIQPLDRVFLHLGPITIYWYGVIIGTGVLIGLWLATREAVRRGLPKETFVDLVLFAVPIAIVCARAYYVLFEWHYYSKHLSEIPKIWQGGPRHSRRFDWRGGDGRGVRPRARAVVLEARRHCRAKHHFRPGDRALGQFHEPRSAWRPGVAPVS